MAFPGKAATGEEEEVSRPSLRLTRARMVESDSESSSNSVGADRLAEGEDEEGEEAGSEEA
jgi:hypothetical protein